jgi:hypothetical protein
VAQPLLAVFLGLRSEQLRGAKKSALNPYNPSFPL